MPYLRKWLPLLLAGCFSLLQRTVLAQTPVTSPVFVYITQSDSTQFDRRPVVVALGADTARRSQFVLPADAYVATEGSLSATQPLLAYNTGDLQAPAPGSVLLHLLDLRDGSATTLTTLLPPQYPANFDANLPAVLAEAPLLAEIGDPVAELAAAFTVGLHTRQWSPDGRYLAFGAAIDGPSTDLYVYDTEADTVRRLSQEPAEIAAIQWSPDSKRIAFETQVSPNCPPCPHGRYVVSTADANLLTLPSGLHDMTLGWLNGDSLLETTTIPSIGPAELRRVDVAAGQTEVLWSGRFLEFMLDDAGAALIVRGTPPGSSALPKQLYWVDLLTHAFTPLPESGTVTEHAHVNSDLYRAFAQGDGQGRFFGDMAQTTHIASPGRDWRVTTDFATIDRSGAQVQPPTDWHWVRSRQDGPIWWRPDATPAAIRQGLGAGYYVEAEGGLYYRSLAEPEPALVAHDALPLGWTVAAGVPPLTVQPVNRTPDLPALRAWAVTGDAVYALGDDWRVYALDPMTLAVIESSVPLATGFVGELDTYLATDASNLFVSAAPAANRPLTQTMVLALPDLSVTATLAHAGPLAVDPQRQLFVADTITGVVQPGNAFWTIWAYDLGNLAKDPVPAFEPRERSFSTLGNLAVDSLHRHLLATIVSPCHGSGCGRTAIYDADTFAPLGWWEDQDYSNTSTPIVASGAGALVTMLQHTSGAGEVRLYTPDGKLIRAADGLDGQVVTDDEAAWIYVLRERGLWVLDGHDLAVRAVMPFTGTPPAAIAVAPAGDRLYLFGNGWLDTIDTAALHILGIPPVAPLPDAWVAAGGYPRTLIRHYQIDPNTGRGVQAIVFDRYGLRPELYRSLDGGLSWDLVTANLQPDYLFQGLSPSPDFAVDGTLALANTGSYALSHDQGATWAPYTPPYLAFASDRGGNRDIYVLAGEHATPRQVTGSPANDEQPAWSPAWTRLAFVSDRDGNPEIYTIEAGCDAARQTEAACAVRRLTNNPADDMLPAWSPDGQWIAFVSTRDGNAEIYLMRSDGTDVRRLTEDPGGDWRPVWMPDGQRLLFASDRSGNLDLYWMDLDAGMQPGVITQLTTDPAADRDPAVARDGTVYFLSERTGVPSTYRFATNMGKPPFDESTYDAGLSSDPSQPEGHPAIAADASTILVSLTDNGATNIYAYGVTPVTGGSGFNGHPAGAPTLWLPPPTPMTAKEP